MVHVVVCFIFTVCSAAQRFQDGNLIVSVLSRNRIRREIGSSFRAPTRGLVDRFGFIDDFVDNKTSVLVG
jgi:hypothetical protein